MSTQVVGLTNRPLQLQPLTIDPFIVASMNVAPVMLQSSTRTNVSVPANIPPQGWVPEIRGDPVTGLMSCPAIIFRKIVRAARTLNMIIPDVLEIGRASCRERGRN